MLSLNLSYETMKSINKINTEVYKIINTFKDPWVSHQPNDFTVAYLNCKV